MVFIVKQSTINDQMSFEFTDISEPVLEEEPEIWKDRIGVNPHDVIEGLLMENFHLERRLAGIYDSAWDLIDELKLRNSYLKNKLSEKILVST